MYCDADMGKYVGATCYVCFIVGLMLYVPVNNFSVMLGRSHRFLGITSTVFFFLFFFSFFFGGGGVNMSCSRRQHGDPSGARTPDLWIRSPSIMFLIRVKMTNIQRNTSLFDQIFCLINEFILKINIYK